MLFKNPDEVPRVLPNYLSTEIFINYSYNVIICYIKKDFHSFSVRNQRFKRCTKQLMQYDAKITCVINICKYIPLYYKQIHVSIFIVDNILLIQCYLNDYIRYIE